MKKLLETLAIVILSSRLFAQSNEPVRLALIAETDEAATASDVLTAKLSGNQKVQLLERNEIEKVYREQGLSAANKNYLKLGRILGADGLLLFDVVRTKAATNLMTRLIAVKPGVILADGSFPWPLKDTASWAESAATFLNSLLPKLALLPKDAIPISVVNLRSAIQSAEGEEAERQLKLLAVQRLSQERQFFVLERQKMQLLSEEKELKVDDSAFWNGSYLLEGVVDQNGYSRDVITINARLTPPKGGVPLLIEVSDSRTNLSGVINHLAEKVTELLKVNSSVPEWNAADEAQQYYDEAKWALRWNIHQEAQAAADAAWALGKHDLDCAIVRIESYIVPSDTGGYQQGEFTNPSSTNQVIRIITEEAASNHLWGLTLREQVFGGIKVVQYVSVGKFPDPKSIDMAAHALQLYYAFSQTLPPGEPKADAAWYRSGIGVLVMASQVLQHYNFIPESQKPAADKLAELRAMTRSVAEWISKSPSVHDSYFVGNRTVTHDELGNTMEESPNLFKCEVTWGCYWQERPEDCTALYRELMSSPVFSYIHKDFWLRDLQTPRLVAWNENDRRRVPMVWSNFVRELDASTNILLRLESKALALADADDEEKLAISFTNLFNCIFENRDALVANPVEVLYLDWGTGALVDAKTGNGIATDTKESLNDLFHHDYWSRLEAMDREYWNKTTPVLAAQIFNPDKQVFEQQKQYLKENKSYDFIEIAKLFSSQEYSKAQALEIQPLLAAYKSNLFAQSQNASGMQKGQLMGGIAQIGFLEDDVKRILNPPAVQPQSQVRTQTLQPIPMAKVLVAATAPTNIPEIVTNVLVVNKFLEIPLDDLIRLNGLESIKSSRVAITAHHWLEGKLLLNFDYDLTYDIYGRVRFGTAIAILDPTTERWDVVGYSMEQTSDFVDRSYHRSTLVHGELFNCHGGQIKKYDFQKKQWQVLPVSDGNNYELFAINGHLYAASQDMIFEILDGGKSTRILASTRRNPPVSMLDREDWGSPILFEGPNHSLRVCTSSKIFTWTGNDWHEDSAARPASSQPEIFVDGVLFRQAGALNAAYQNNVIFRQTNGVYGVMVSQDEISCLATETNVTKLCLKGDQGDWRTPSRPGTNPAQVPKPFWQMPANLLPNLPATLRQSDLYLLENLFAAHAIINDRHEIVQDNVVAKDEYNAVLLCFSHDFPLPQKVFLKFDPSDAQRPVWIFSVTNLLLFAPEAKSTDIGGSGRAGVWLMPVSRLDPVIAAQKEIQLEQRAKEKAAVEQAQKEKEQAQKNLLASLLAKYDWNHNGMIDPDEKEAALDDPTFIESELDLIDANHNGWLDAEELVYFDANRNKILEPKEQAGIEIAQHLLAERLLKKFDANGDGLLDRTEFNNLLQASMEPSAVSIPGLSFPFPDDNHDGHVDLAELETFLKQQTRRGLRWRRMPDAFSFTQMRMDASQSVDSRQMFKAAVESYWQNPGSITNRPPFSRRVLPNGGAVTNGTQSGTIP